jgi:hypothetical protein
VYAQNISRLQSQPWNFHFQGNQRLPEGGNIQVNSFITPNLGKTYPGSMNPTLGQNFQSNDPFQGILPNQSTCVGYSTQNPPPSNLSGLSNYLHTDYGPTGIST